jgi:hypothetical protein
MLDFLSRCPSAMALAALAAGVAAVTNPGLALLAGLFAVRTALDAGTPPGPVFLVPRNG